ncbi:MAG: tyrosine-type recombinase/integrase [Microbacteriaceae bacterium]
MTDFDDDEFDEHLAGLRRAGLPVVDRRGPLPVGEWRSTVVADEDGSVALAGSTRAVYRAAWERFMVWCRVHGIADPVTVGPGEVVAWVESHVRAGHTPAFIRRERAGVRHHLVRYGAVVPATDDPLVREAIAVAAAARGSAQRRAVPLRLDEARRVMTGIALTTRRRHTDQVVSRDRALIGLGWALGERAGVLVGLDVDDLRFTDAGVAVTVPAAAGGERVVVVPWARLEATCPVRAAMALTRARKAGALFRHTDRHGRVQGRLTVEGVTRVVRRHVAGILLVDPSGYTSQSLRAGFVAEARARGVGEAAIRAHLGRSAPTADGSVFGDWW